MRLEFFTCPYTCGCCLLKESTTELVNKVHTTVFSERESLQLGIMLAFKKVRFDNFEPESVRFISREIMILRKLDHPNYMEHDIAGLSSCPDIQFSEAQVKFYMHQLLCGLEHCHSRGIMNRDIKGSNLLVSDDGVLKIADFGLANFVSAGYTQPLTIRVVTLWYRPPELLLGSTSYGKSVDLWSVGCLFAELLLGKHILKGRTKLCGSQPDEYWKKFKLPHATIFKPLNSDASSLSYFITRPYACHQSSLPKYPPNKEIDARTRDEARRKRAAGRARKYETTRRRARVSNVFPEPKHAVPPKVYYSSGFLDTFKYAISIKMEVLNLSLGGPSYSPLLFC
ncbi:hypothetical protein MKX03_024099 [Papaver bracteatum]|nr:hypothetical protein MKX03_024099 [Papaver bracteatum]